MAGSWDDPVQWAFPAMQMVHLPSGKILAYGAKPTECYLWDPVADTFTQKPISARPSGETLLNSGLASLPDGRAIVVGGSLNAGDPKGSAEVDIFDHNTEAWLTSGNRPPNLNEEAGTEDYSRFRPTAMPLANGKILAMGGLNSDGDIVNRHQIFDPASPGWSFAASGLNADLGDYPFLFVLHQDVVKSSVPFPAGSVFFAGPEESGRSPRIFDLGGGVVSTSFSTGSPNPGLRAGATVMYRPGKIMKCSGGSPGGANARTIDMTAGTPAWGSFPSLAYGRRNLSLVLLADGTLLAVGGNKYGSDAQAEAQTGLSDFGYFGPVFATEIIDPTAGSPAWATNASLEDPRWFHSTAMLLPDARVIVAGGLNQYSVQIFSPPYLDGDPERNTISSVSASAVNYNSTFTITLSTPISSPTAVFAIRLPAVSGWSDSGQRIVELSFSFSSPTLTVTSPVDANTAPPGYYMIWVLAGSNTRVPCQRCAYVKFPT